MAGVNVVLFDLDDTILDYSGEAARCWSEACATVAGPAGVDVEALRAAIRDVGTLFWSDPERHRLERTDMLGAWRKIVEGALDRCGGLRDRLAARVAEDFAAGRRGRSFPTLFPRSSICAREASRSGSSPTVTPGCSARKSSAGISPASSTSWSSKANSAVASPMRASTATR